MCPLLRGDVIRVCRRFYDELPPDFDPEIERTLLSRLRQRRQETVQHAMSDPSSSSSGRVGVNSHPERPEGPNPGPFQEGLVESDHEDEHDNADAINDQNSGGQDPVAGPHVQNSN